MTRTPETHLIPAQNPTDPDTSTGTHGEGVKAVGKLDPRKGRKRAWDELSEIDRAVLLESVRRRRDAEKQRAALYNEIFGMRSNR